MSQNNVSIEKLKSLSKAIKTGEIKNEDETKTMKEIINILKDINAKASIEAYFDNNEDEIKYFMNGFIDFIVQNILEQPYVFGKDADDIALDLLFQIYRLFPTFHKKNYSSLFESIRKIFKNHHNTAFFFPENKINIQKQTSNYKKKYTFSRFNKDFCSDFVDKNKSKFIYYVGNQVDILVDYNSSRTDIDKKAWVRGIIKKVENGFYYIDYNGEENEITIPIGSNKVQPGESKTQDWDWRTNLKRYDLVDVYDRGTWWPCTITDVIEEIDKEGIKRVKYRIGFRLYLTHFNNPDDKNDTLINHTSFWEDTNAKSDENNQEYIGDDREKDEELYHFSKRIQKFNSYSETQKQSKEDGDQEIMQNLNDLLANDNIPEDNTENDYYLYENNNKKNIILGKTENFSYYFACLLKKMENEGDFETFINIITDKPNNEELFTIFTIYLNSLDYIHSQYFEQNKEILKKSFFDYIECLDDKEIKNLPKELTDLSTKFLNKINEINNSNNKIIDIEELLNLKLAFKMIKTSTFEKRLNGIKSLNNIINKYQNNENALANISREIKESKIIEEIFGANYHSQIISKSTEPVKLLLKYNNLDEEDIKLIWFCTQKGDLEVKLTIIDLLIELIPIFNDDFIGHLLNGIVGVSDGKPNDKETDFVYRLSSITKNQENKMKICQYFCKSIFELKTFKRNNPVFEKFTQLMKQDENYLIKALEICQEHIKENDHTLICNSLITELFHNFIIFMPNENPPYQCLKESLNEFLKDEHLIKIFEDNFTNYIKIVKEKFKSENINSIEQIFVDGFNHVDNVNGRLAFLKSIITKIYPNYEFIFKLKDLLIDNPVIPEDKKYFYQFMEAYCFLGGNNIKNETIDKARIELFKIFAEKDQTDINYSEFILFIKTFLYLNNSLLDYKIIKKDEGEYDYEISLKKNIKYDEIKGMEVLWKMIFEVKEEIVLSKLINVIYQMVQDQMVIVNNIVLDEKEQNSEKSQKCSKLLKIFFIESEKNIVVDIKSHNSLLKNAIIKFPLHMTNENDNYNNNFITELFYDNTSLNEIKEELMKKYQIPMEFIEAYIIKDDRTVKLDYTYNNKSLKEIIIDDLNNKKENKKIQFDKTLIFSIKKVNKKELIIMNGELTPRFINILKEWYKEFTNDEVMNKKNFANFISKITNTNGITESDKRVVKAFLNYDKAENGFLTEENFISFYYNSIFEDKDIRKVWNHLENMGYNEYLYKKDKPLEVKHIENINLFRYRLNAEDFINEFIDLYNTYPESDYDLIFYLPTNQNIYEEILDKFNYDSNLFDNVFGNEENTLMQLYYLIIIESFLQDIELKNLDIKKIFKNPNNSTQELCSKKYEPFESIDIEKKIKFVEDFIKNKNYGKLIEYNIEMLNKYKRHQNELINKCFRKGLKIMKIIFESFLDYNPKNKYNILTEDNIYYFDYTHINNEFKDKNEIKEIILSYSFSNIFKNIMSYILKNNNNNNVDELYNDCFDIIIKFLAFKDKLLDEFISNEKIKNSFYDLITKHLLFNSSAIISSLTDTLKKLSYISYSSNNKFILFLYDIMNSIFNNPERNKNIFLSNEFFEFFTQINDCIYNTEKDPNNKLLLNIIEMLINNIKEKEKEKKLPDEILTKYLELLINLIEKNSKIKQQILSYKVNDEALSDIIMDKIILSGVEKEKNKNENKNINKIASDSKDFIVIGKIEEEDNDEQMNDKLTKACEKYILACLKDEKDPNTIKELIKLNRIIKEKKENDLNNYNNNNNNNLLLNQIKTVYTHTKSLKVCGHLGLYNLGSICYMNSIMQQLYMVPTFRYAIMGVDDNDPINPTLKYGDRDDNLFHQLQVMFSYLNLSEKQYFNPKYFCYSFKDFDGKPTNPKIQQDSMEFYNLFCDKIEKILAKTKYKYIINDVFMGKSCSSVICDSCHNISNTFENIYNLTLEVKNINNLNDSLQKLIVPETIDGYKCPGCNKNVTIQKITSLCKLPNILFVHLKRFYLRYETLQTEKINSKFEFPTKINLKNFCVEKLQQNENESDEIYFKKEEYYEYILKGVNVHIGHASGGHYISFIDTNRDGKGNTMKILNKNEKQNWLKFNDSNVSKYDLNNLPYDCFGGEIRNNIQNSQNAYLLIYERVKKTPIKVLIDENNISEDKKNNIITFKKDEEESINKKYDISKINSDIKEEELYKMIFYNEEKNEYYKYIPFYNIPKYAPKFLYNKIRYENKQLLKGNTKEEDNNTSEIQNYNKFENNLYNKLLNKQSSEIIQKYSAAEQNDIIKILFFNIFIMTRKNNLSDDEKIEINNNMKTIIKNAVKPLCDENTNAGVLEIILKTLLNKNNIEIIFSNDSPILDEIVVKEIYECINKLNKILYYQNRLAIYDVFDNVVNYYKNIKLNTRYNGSNEKNPIKYIYSILKDLIENNNDLITKSTEQNLIYLLISGIEKEHLTNQTTIFSILKILIRSTEDYNEQLFFIQEKETKESKTQFKYKNKLKDIFLRNDIIEIFFDRASDLLFILIKIFEYKDKDFSDKFNISCLPSLMDFSIKNEKIIRFIELLYIIIDIKDDNCLNRMKQLLGFPTLVIKPKSNNEKVENKRQKWPIFGAELIKNNNNDLKTEIYKYISFYNKKPFCILSYLLPYTSGNNNYYKLISHDNRKIMIYQLILKCFSNTTNYLIFKYLYLLPARSLYYKNAYEELKDIIKNDSSCNLKMTTPIEEVFIQKVKYELYEIYKKRYPNREKLQKIERPEFPEDIGKYNRNILIIEEFLGFNPDFIPGEIVKEEIQTIVKSRYLELLRIEYFTTYYKIDDLKKLINENKEINLNNKKENENKNIEINEKLDEKEKIITVDISNKDYQKDEDKLINNISKKLGSKVNKIIIEDGTIVYDEDNVINSLIRYILINKKPINNKIQVNIKLKDKIKEHIKDNICIPEFLYDYVDRHNYVDFLDINRIKKDEKLIEKDDIYVSINSKAYINDK